MFARSAFSALPRINASYNVKSIITRRSNTDFAKYVDNIKRSPVVKSAAEAIKSIPKPAAATKPTPKAKSSSEKPAHKTESKESRKSSDAQQKAQETAQQFASTGMKFASQIKQAFKSGDVLRTVRGSVSDTRQAVIDANASRYGGLTSKAYRRRIRTQRMGGVVSDSEKVTDEDVNAGANVVLHKDSKWKEAWDGFKTSNPMVQGVFSMRRRYEESDNAMANTARFLTDKLTDLFGPMFEETEHGATIAEIREIDPTFTVEEFMKEAREFMIPEILEAYIEWDEKTLKEWCSDSVFSILQMSREVEIEKGHSIEGNLLDLRNVDLAMAKMMEDTPILILSFKTQQTEVVRNAKGEVVTGSPDHINDVHYIFAVTKDTDKPNALTKGWKVVELAIQAVRESI